MNTHSSHLGIKKPLPTGGKAVASTALTREEREFGEAGARSGVRYPLNRLKVLCAPAIDRMSGGLLFGGAIGCAEVGPINIGADVFRTHGTMGDALDAGAVVGWYVATAHPVAHHLRRNPQFSGQRRLASDDVDGFFEGFHAATINRWVRHVNKCRQKNSPCV